MSAKVLDKKRELDFVRMDIEGSEVEVLEGMKRTLKAANPGFKILLELHPHISNLEVQT